MMNFVWYVALAGHTPTIHAHHPSRVKAWEPVPSFAAFTQYGLLLNNLTHLVEVGLVVGACGVEFRQACAWCSSAVVRT